MFAERRYDDQPAEPTEPWPEWLAHTLRLILGDNSKLIVDPPIKIMAAIFLRNLEIDRLPVPLFGSDADSVGLYWTRDGRHVWFRIEGPVTFWAYKEVRKGVESAERGSMITECPALARELVGRVFGTGERGFVPDVLDRLRMDEESRVVR